MVRDQFDTAISKGSKTIKYENTILNDWERETNTNGRSPQAVAYEKKKSNLRLAELEKALNCIKLVLSVSVECFYKFQGLKVWLRIKVKILLDTKIFFFLRIDAIFFLRSVVHYSRRIKHRKCNRFYFNVVSLRIVLRWSKRSAFSSLWETIY